MDLGAYMNIDALREIAERNNIDIPRLRGYRLMKDEEVFSAEDIQDMTRSSEIRVCERLCRAEPFWNPKAYCHEYSYWTDRLCGYYLIEGTDRDYERFSDIRWDRIHGWKRRILKFEVKKDKRSIQKQHEMWNKYVGKDGVLYIHARIGGPNWEAYGGPELEKQPWFLEKVDDCFDSTYCDIYAQIR